MLFMTRMREIKLPLCSKTCAFHWLYSWENVHVSFFKSFEPSRIFEEYSFKISSYKKKKKKKKINK